VSGVNYFCRLATTILAGLDFVLPLLLQATEGHRR